MLTTGMVVVTRIQPGDSGRQNSYGQPTVEPSMSVNRNVKISTGQA
jgi:hypothetical protein